MYRSLLLTSLLVASSSSAQQTSPAPASASPTIKESAVSSVEVTGTVDAVRRNDTASRIVVTNAELVKYGDAGVLDALKRLPGVTVQGTDVRLRGLGSGYTQLLVNGERPPAGFSLDTLSPDMVERVEILRAATAEFSTQAIAGTVNLVLRKTMSKDSSADLKLFTGAANGQRNASTTSSMSGRSGNLSYLMAANLNYNKRAIPQNDTVEKLSADGALTQKWMTNSLNTDLSSSINLNSRLSWKLQGEDSFTWQTFANGGNFRGNNNTHAVTLVGPAYPYSLHLADFDGTFLGLRSDMNWLAKFVDGGKLDAKLGISGSDNERFVGRQGLDKTDILVLDRDFTTRGKDRGISTNGKYSAPWLAEHAIGLGWDFTNNKYRENEIQNDAPLDGQIQQDFDNSYSASIVRLAAYVQDEWDISKDWSVYLGARWEGVRTNSTSTGIDSSSRLSVLSPLVQSLYKIQGSKGDRLRFALTRTYKAPVLFQLIPRHFYSSVNTAISPDSSGNANLKPELALGIDAAFEHYWSEGALLSIAVSSRAIEGPIRYEVHLVGDRYVSAPYNQGEAHVKNLELEAKFPLKAVLENAKNIDLRASASRNWSSVDGVPGPDNRLANQPRLSANFGVDIKFGQWTSGASFSYVEGSWSRSSLTESRNNSSRRDLEAYALYKLTPKAQFRISVRDLLRADSVNEVLFVDGNGTYHSTSTTPARSSWRFAYEQKY